MIFQQGTVNLTALIVPDIYVQIIPPQYLLNGVPTNVAGAVGTAQWGPVNNPTLVANMQDYARLFGAVMPRKYDMGTMIAMAVLQGANNFRCVRVTDGTDVAATTNLSGNDKTRVITIGGTITAADIVTLSITPSGGSQVNVSYTVAGGDTTQIIAAALAAAINANATLIAANITASAAATSAFKLHYFGTAPTVASSVSGSASETVTPASEATTSTVGLTLSGKYTGSLGNAIVGQLVAGSQANSWRLTVAIPGQTPEVFDNIGPNLQGQALWKAIAFAINNGMSGLRGPSQIVVATVGIGTADIVANTAIAFSGGTDGASITTQNLLGVDTTPRTGMYALRAQGVSIAALTDCDDSTTWATQVSFGLAEGIYMIGTTIAGDTAANAKASKISAGIDTFAMKIMFGDWVYWNDVVNGQPQRLVSPQGPMLGMLANLSPEQSSLNKQMWGIVGTQKSVSGLTYSNAELAFLAQAGLDVITNPCPGGDYFGARIGHNASSNPAVWGDNYTRMTNYIASTINKGMGIYVGQLQTPDERRRAKVTLDAYFAELAQFGMIGTPDGLSQPWQVTLNNSNNPFNLVALGYQIADVQVTYLSVIEKFIINLQGGQTVQVVRQSTTPNT